MVKQVSQTNCLLLSNCFI